MKILIFYVFKSYIAMLRSSEPWSHHINKIVIRLDRFFALAHIQSFIEETKAPREGLCCWLVGQDIRQRISNSAGGRPSRRDRRGRPSL
jgi:hypothetical protein